MQAAYDTWNAERKEDVGKIPTLRVKERSFRCQQFCHAPCGRLGRHSMTASAPVDQVRLCRLLTNSSFGAVFVAAALGPTILINELHTWLFEGTSYHFKCCSTHTMRTAGYRGNLL
jgi:hypothetical protein